MIRINSNNLTCIVPTNNSSGILEICLATMKHYIPELTNIWIIDRESQDNTQEIVRKYGCNYFDFPINQQRILSDEHVDSIKKGIELSNSEWILFIHNDVEFCGHNFWEEINRYAENDIIYGFINSVMVAGPLNYAPHTSFLLVKRKIILEAKNDNVDFKVRCDEGKIYDVFYDFWKWAELNNKKIIKMDNTDFYIHYGGYTNFKFNPAYCNNSNIKFFMLILNKIILTKLEYLRNHSLPFPDKTQNALNNVLNKNKSR
jgi:glycosyltransferase involved in cell wall biosynthesis